MGDLARTSPLSARAQTVRPKPMIGVRWHSVDLRTGRRGAPVVAQIQGTISRILSEATEATLVSRIPGESALYDEWVAATEPGYVMLVAVDSNDVPIWGGMLYKRVATASEWATLSLVTLEAYLDRRYADANYRFYNSDQISVIALQMVQTTLADGIGFTIDAPYSNWLRDRTYLVDDDKTILSILQELADVQGGIEFTVDIAWTDDTATTLDRILRFRNRLGTAYLGEFGVQNNNPPSVFTMPGSVTDFEYTEDYGSDNGANAVIAVSSGEGDTRPESMNNIAGGVVYGFGGNMVLFERRFTPSTSITDTGTLDDHAYQELLQTWDGLRQLTLTANLDTAPQVNVDWFLGDDVGVSLICPRFPERMSSDGGKVAGYLATLRVIGWEIDIDARQLKPTLIELNEVEVETL